MDRNCKIHYIMSYNRAFLKCYGDNFTSVDLLCQYFLYKYIYIIII